MGTTLKQDNRFLKFIEALEDLWGRSGPPAKLADFDPILEFSRQLTSTKEDRIRLCEDSADFIEADQYPRGMSYKHQHGFTKLSLYRSPKHQFNVRTHIWWDSEISDESPHEHRWPFCSTLLSGALRVANFVIAEEGGPNSAEGETVPHVQHKFYDADKAGDKAVEVVRQVELMCAAKVRIVAGSQHMLWHDQPHQVFGEGGEVSATFLITGAACREFSNVYRGMSFESKKRELAGKHMTADQIAEELRLYAREIETPGQKHASAA